MRQSSIKLLGLDIETSMRANREGFSTSTPWDTNNDILVTCAVVVEDGKLSTVTDYAYPSQTWENFEYALHHEVTGLPEETIMFLVGHNIKFDLNYLFTRTPKLYNILATLPVWDTMIAEYILSGQTKQFASLHSCLESRSLGTTKGSLLADTIEAGHTTDDISIPDLIAYCRQDVQATLALATEQMKEAREKGQINLILMHSSVTKAYAEIECNGMRFNSAKALSEITDIRANLAILKAGIAMDVSSRIHGITGNRDEALILSKDAEYLGSNQFWSAYFFGGSYCFKWKEAADTYKSGPKKGQLRYKHMQRDVMFSCLYDPIKAGSERTKTGSWCVDESVISNVASADHCASLLKTYRHLNKLLSTYFMSLMQKTWGGILHPNINQCSTNTGRTSQSNPNLQNIASEDRVKKCFVPSEKDLCYIEADYKQLEMIVFAFIYRDPQLMDDLRAGIDIHTLIGQKLFGTSFNDNLRRAVKGVNFGMIYGGGANTLSEQVGLPVTTVKKVIDYFNARYPTIRAKRKEISGSIVYRCRTDPSTVDGKYGYMLPSITSRRYFIEVMRKPVPSGIELVPHYTSMCNYPIQGLATGDIVQMMILHLWHRIREELKPISMVNTVHDSILFEVPTCDVRPLMDWIKEELESAPKVFEQWFDVPFDFHLPVSVKYSTDSWAGPWREWTPF